MVKHNKKTLSELYGKGYKIFVKHLNTMLSDPEIKEEFGEYSGRCFTDKQLNIIQQELGISIQKIKEAC